MTIQYDILTDTEEQQRTQLRHIKLFNRDVTRDLLEDLTVFYGERPGPRHRDALSNLVWAATTLADRRDYKDDTVPLLSPSETRRPCFNLDCGMAKSRALVSWCAVNARNGFPYSILILAEKLDELEALYQQLVGHGQGQKGIARDLVGVWHSDERRDALPSNTPEECAARPILLLSHAKATTNPSWANEYAGGDRDLVWYDESLVATQSASFPVEQTVDALQDVGNRFRYGKLKAADIEGGELLRDTTKVLERMIDDEYERQEEAEGGVDAKPLTLANPFDEEDLVHMTEALDALDFPDETVALVETMLRAVQAGRPMRVWRLKAGSSAVISFDLKVPEEYRRVVVTDASFDLRDILHMTEATLEVPYGEKSGQALKTYSRVRFNLAKLKSGKNALAEEFGQKRKRDGKLGKPRREGRLTAYVKHAVQQTPEGEACIIWYRKDFDARLANGTKLTVKMHDVLRERLASVIDLDETVTVNGEEKPRWVFKSWGRHTADSSAAYCRHVVFTGLYYLPDHVVAGMAAGQEGDITLKLTGPELFDLQLSEARADLHQALNRAAMRRVNAKGEAEETTVWLPLPDQRDALLSGLIAQALPGSPSIHAVTLDGLLEEARLVKLSRLRWTLMAQAETMEVGEKLMKGRLRNGEPGLWALAELESMKPDARALLLRDALKEPEVATLWEAGSKMTLTRR